MKSNKILNSIYLASAALILFLIFVSSTASAATAESASTTAPCAYITNYYEGTVSIIDITTNTVKATVPVREWPFGVAVNPAGTKVYVTTTYGEDKDGVTDLKGVVSVIDTATNTVTATVPVGEWPRGVAVSPDGKTVYAVDSGKYPDYTRSVSVIDAATNTVKAMVPVGNHPEGVAINPTGTKVYVASSNVYIIDTATNTVTATVPVGDYPFGVAVTPDGAKVYVSNADSNTVSAIDTATNTVTATVPVGDYPCGVAVTPDGAKVYVSNADSNTVSAIDTATNTVTATVPVDYPCGVAVTPDGTKVYVGNDASKPVSIIDIATNTVTATVYVGDGSFAFGQFIGPLSLAPFANFSAKPTEGKAPLTVAFTDESTRSPTKWKWDFGDGTSSTKQNPTHKYSKVGVYTVKLTVTNAAGSNTVTKADYIKVVTKPVAAFSASPTSGKAPLNVKFTDKSTGLPERWKWSFGDGTISREQNPEHQYLQEGNYKITLTVSNAAGSSTATKTNYIKVTTNTRPGIYSENK
ncbi:MAG: PKD domain-containing protein [Methanosarcina vacuolata]|jgi:YVTN family beta-propeller protein|nr:PKD domain-containing protein [Methanosarcina vacuolata]